MSVTKICQLCVEDEAAVRDLMSDFFHNEPVSRMLQINVRDSNVYIDIFFPQYLKDEVSVVAVDNGGKIVGFRLATVLHNNNLAAPPFTKDDPDTRNIALLREIVYHLYRGVDIYTKYNMDRLVRLRALFVSQSHRRQGIATKMVEKTLELARKKGIRLASVEATSSFSARLFEKLGFEKLSEVTYDSITVDGKPLTMTDELKYHRCLALYAKTL